MPSSQRRLHSSHTQGFSPPHPSSSRPRQHDRGVPGHWGAEPGGADTQRDGERGAGPKWLWDRLPARRHVRDSGIYIVPAPFYLHSQQCWTKCLPRNQFPASFSSPSTALLPPSPWRMGSFWELSAAYVQKKPRSRCNPECWESRKGWDGILCLSRSKRDPKKGPESSHKRH